MSRIPFGELGISSTVGEERVVNFVRSHRRSRFNGSIPVALICACVAFFTGTAMAADVSEQQELVDQARLTIERFAADESMEWFHRHKKEAWAVLIVPKLTRGALVFGGAGGSGVFLARDERTGRWSQPVFYTIGSTSFGLQIGRDVRELILVIRSRRGLESFYTSAFRLGGDASVAAGPSGRGTGAKGVTQDIVSFSRGSGAYAGVSLEGAWVAVSDASNEAYYGEPARPADILLKDSIVNPESLDLRDALVKAMK